LNFFFTVFEEEAVSAAKNDKREGGDTWWTDSH